MFAVIIIGASSFIGVNAEASAAFVGWVKEVTGNLFAYRYEGEAMVSTVLKYELAQIPDGYTEIFLDHADEGGSALYENEIGQYLQFMYTSNSGDSNLFIETTSATIYQTGFNDYTATVMVSDDPEISNSISWVGENDTVFYISGFFDVDSLLDMAGNIKSTVLNEPEADNSTQYYELPMIPDGYSLVHEREREDSRSLLYANESGQMLQYHCLAPGNSTEGFIAVENCTQKTAKVHGYHADLFASNDAETSSCVVWTDEHNYTHALHAFLEETELIKLAESVKLLD